ncbi:MAG: hypothetical protein ABIO44_00365 [Saprospiraceae bacterium]
MSIFVNHKIFRMDFGKLKTWMKKMNQILDLYEDNEEFTETERNLLMDYTHRMALEIQKLNVIDDKIEQSHLEIFGKVKENNIKVEQFVHVDKSTLKNEEIRLPPTQINVDEIIPEAIEVNSNLDEYPQLFDHLEVHDLNSKLELKPLSDIKFGMGLNEKILAQNELFNGDKAAFEEIIQKLNECSDFNKAKAFLCNNVIPKYNWTNSSKEKTVDTFIKLVKRRHL